MGTYRQVRSTVSRPFATVETLPYWAIRVLPMGAMGAIPTFGSIRPTGPVDGQI